MKRTITGVDIYIVQKEIPKITSACPLLQLTTIFNRGTKIFPGAAPVCHLTDVYQCRFEVPEEAQASLSNIKDLLHQLEQQGFHWCEVHNIYRFE